MSKKIVRKLAALVLVFSLVFSAGVLHVVNANTSETVATEAHKAEANEKLKSLMEKGLLTEEELNEFVKQVNEAETLDIIEDILGEAGYFTQEEEPEVDPLAKQKAEAKEKLKSLKDAGKISEEALNDFAKQVDEADSLDIIEDILGEAGYFTESEEETPGETESEEETKDESKDESKEETKKETSTEKNPSTGDMGVALAAATLLTSAGAYVFTSRKKEDK